MFMPYPLVKSMKKQGVCGVNVYCNPSEIDKVLYFIQHTLQTEWQKAVDHVRSQKYFKEVEENYPCPLSIIRKGDHILLLGDELCIWNPKNKLYIDTKAADKALLDTLRLLLDHYSVQFEGQIAFILDDYVMGYELSSTEPDFEIDDNIGKTYDFVGEKLSEGLDCNTFKLENPKECHRIIALLKLYAKWMRKEDIDKICRHIVKTKWLYDMIRGEDNNFHIRYKTLKEIKAFIMKYEPDFLKG